MHVRLEIHDSPSARVSPKWSLTTISSARHGVTDSWKTAYSSKGQTFIFSHLRKSSRLLEKVVGYTTPGQEETIRILLPSQARCHNLMSISAFDVYLCMVF